MAQFRKGRFGTNQVRGNQILASPRTSNASQFAAGSINVGPSTNFVSSAQLVKTNIWALTATTAIISYHDYTNNGLYAVIASLSGTTITYGTPVLIKSNFTPYGSTVVALTASTALIVYEENTGNYLAARVLTISGTSISVGSEVTNGVVSQYPSLVPLTSTTALCVYSGRAVVISVSGTTPSFGSVVLATGGVNSSIVVSALSSTSAVMIRDNPSSGNAPTINVMTISGTTITMGSNYQIESTGVSNSNGFTGIAATSSTGAIAVWMSAAGSNLTRAVAMTISGTTPTFGSIQNVGSEAVYTSMNQSMAPISSSQAIFTFTSSTTGYGGAYIFTSTGTSLTTSLQTVFSTANVGGVSIGQMNGTTLLNPYRVGASYGASQVIVCA
jgi:hypothetical protein